MIIYQGLSEKHLKWAYKPLGQGIMVANPGGNELGRERIQVRRQFNAPKRTEDWQPYRTKLEAKQTRESWVHLGEKDVTQIHGHPVYSNGSPLS